MQLSPTKIALLRALSKHGPQTTADLSHIAAREINLYKNKEMIDIKKGVGVQLSQMCSIKDPLKKDLRYLKRVYKIKVVPGARGGSCQYCVYSITREGVNFLQELDTEKDESSPSDALVTTINVDHLPRLNSVFALGDVWR